MQRSGAGRGGSLRKDKLALSIAPSIGALGSRSLSVSHLHSFFSAKAVRSRENKCTTVSEKSFGETWIRTREDMEPGITVSRRVNSPANDDPAILLPGVERPGRFRKPEKAFSSRQNLEEPMTFAVIDFETTGLMPERNDRVIEAGVVLVDSEGKVEQEWTTLVNP